MRNEFKSECKVYCLIFEIIDFRRRSVLMAISMKSTWCIQSKIIHSSHLLAIHNLWYLINIMINIIIIKYRINGELINWLVVYWSVWSEDNAKFVWILCEKKKFFMFKCCVNICFSHVFFGNKTKWRFYLKRAQKRFIPKMINVLMTFNSDKFLDKYYFNLSTTLFVCFVC